MRSVAGRSEGPPLERAGTTGPFRNRTTTTLVVLAAVWSVGLVVAGAVVPAYDSSTTTITSTSTPGSVPRTHQVAAHQTTATLLAVNGPKVLVLLALPLLATVIVAGLLAWEHSRGRPGAVVAAWVVTALVGLVAQAGILTVGSFVLPVPALLDAACARSTQEPGRLSQGPTRPPALRGPGRRTTRAARAWPGGSRAGCRSRR